MNSQHPKSAKRRTWLVCEVDSHQGQTQGIRTESRTTSSGSDIRKRPLLMVVSRTNMPSFSNTKRKHFSSMWITLLIGTWIKRSDWRYWTTPTFFRSPPALKSLRPVIVTFKLILVAKASRGSNRCTVIFCRNKMINMPRAWDLDS